MLARLEGSGLDTVAEGTGWLIAFSVEFAYNTVWSLPLGQVLFWAFVVFLVTFPFWAWCYLTFLTNGWNDRYIHEKLDPGVRTLLYLIAIPGATIGMVVAILSVVGAILGVIVLVIFAGVASGAARTEVASFRADVRRAQFRDDVRRAVDDAFK